MDIITRQKNLFLWIVFSIFLTENALNVSAQNNDAWEIGRSQIIMNSPEASDLIKYFNYPVNHSTGIPEIEIPLFNVELKGFILPVKLTYHSSGEKVFETGGRIGLGWTLVAEPQIAVQANGRPDEEFLWENNAYKLLWEANSDKERRENLVKAAYGEYDYVPDQFFYRLCGKSGSFFTDRWVDKNSFETYYFDPIQITREKSNNTFRIVDSDGSRYVFRPMDKSMAYVNYLRDKSMHTHTSCYKADSIITPYNETVKFDYGAKGDYSYYVGADMASLEVSDYRMMPYPTYYDGDFVYGNLNSNYDDTLQKYGSDRSFYSKIKILLHSYSYNQYTTTVNMLLKGTGEAGRSLIQNAGMSPKTSDARSIQYIKSTYCNKISYPNGEVEISYKEKGSTSVIDKIVQKDKNGNIVKYFKFYIGRFSSKERLDSIQLCDRNGVRIASYQFDYYGENSNCSFDAKIADPWGFNKISNYSPSFPLLSTDFVVHHGSSSKQLNFKYGSDNYYKEMIDIRLADGSYYYSDDITYQYPWDSGWEEHNPALTMLKTIVYPTGGYTEFKYERNRVLDSVSNFGSVQRIIKFFNCYRIVAINNYNKTGDLQLSKKYKYGVNENGFGIPFKNLTDLDFITTTVSPVYTLGASSLGCYFNRCHDIYKTLFHSSPVGRTGFESGSPVLYSQVTEYETIGTNINGKTIYYYNMDNIQDITPERQFVYYGNDDFKIWTNAHIDRKKDWKIGELIRKEYYKSAGNGDFQPISSTEYKYEKTAKNSVQVYNVHPIQDYQFYDLGTTCPNGYDYKEDIIRLKAGTSSKLQGQEPLIEFGYTLFSNVSILLKKEIEITDNVKKEIDYTYNNKNQISEKKTVSSDGKTIILKYKYPADFSTIPYTTMVSKNILDPLIETNEYIGTVWQRRNINQYTLWGNNSIPVINKQQLSLTPATVNSVEDRVVYHHFTKRGDPVFLTIDGNENIVYLYGYNYQYPIAEIKNASYSQVKTALGNKTDQQIEDLFSAPGFWLDVSLLRTNLPDAFITIYRYKPLVGIESITNPQGVTVYYIYDEMGRLKTIEDDDKNTIEYYEYQYK